MLLESQKEKRKKLESNIWRSNGQNFGKFWQKTYINKSRSSACSCWKTILYGSSAHFVSAFVSNSVSSSMFLWQIIMDERDSVSLLVRRQICFMTIIIKMSLFRQKLGRFVSSALWKTGVSSTVIQIHWMYSILLGCSILHHGTWEATVNQHEHEVYAVLIHMSNKIFCLLTRSIMSSASIHETISD